MKRPTNSQRAKRLMRQTIHELQFYREAIAASSHDGEEHFRTAIQLTIEAVALHLGVQP